MEWVKKLFDCVSKLKEIKRKGWVVKAGVKDPESVAAHSYSVALLSALIAETKGLDVEKAVLMALIHDLAECETGDMTPEEKDMQLEDSSTRQILSTLPEPIKGKLLKLWDEYRKGTSKEAKLVKEIDKLDMGLQALTYSKRFPSKDFTEFLTSAKASVKSEELRKLLD